MQLFIMRTEKHTRHANCWKSYVEVIKYNIHSPLVNTLAELSIQVQDLPLLTTTHIRFTGFLIEMAGDVRCSKHSH